MTSTRDKRKLFYQDPDAFMSSLRNQSRLQKYPELQSKGNGTVQYDRDYRNFQKCHSEQNTPKADITPFRQAGMTIRRHPSKRKMYKRLKFLSQAEETLRGVWKPCVVAPAFCSARWKGKETDRSGGVLRDSSRPAAL